MKPIQLFTSMLALATIVVSSCSAPKYAQQNTVSDDVYNTTAQAKEYVPQAVSQSVNSDSNTNDEYYGTNDPYYDMSYSSRINRFYYGSPWRGYYDPYFDYYGMNAYPWYGMSGSWGRFYSPFYDPWAYGWGGGWGLGWSYASPWWGYNNFGWNSYYGGGFLGGGYYGGGFYTGRTTIVPDYNARPTRGSTSGYRPTRPAGAMGGITPGRDRGQSYTPGSNRTSTVGSSRGTSSGSGSNGSTGTMSRPTRTSTPAPTRESYTPPARTERSYTPPPSSSGSSSRGSSGGNYGGGSSSGGGGGRPTRGGGR